MVKYGRCGWKMWKPRIPIRESGDQVREPYETGIGRWGDTAKEMGR